MSTDDDDTPQIKPRSRTHWTDDDRAAISAAARKRRLEAPSPGVPMTAGPYRTPTSMPDPGDITSPFDLFAPSRPRERPGENVVDLAAQLRAAAPDAYDLIAVLSFELRNARAKDSSATTQLTENFRTFISRSPGGPVFDELKATVVEIKRQHVVAGRFALALVGGLIGGVIYVVNAISTSAELKGSNAARIHALEVNVDRLQDLSGVQPPPRRKDNNP